MSRKGGDERRHREPLCVHILDRGVVLCGFCAHHLPSEWPPGHYWVPLHDPRGATCAECKARVPQQTLRLT